MSEKSRICTTGHHPGVKRMPHSRTPQHGRAWERCSVRGAGHKGHAGCGCLYELSRTGKRTEAESSPVVARLGRDRESPQGAGEPLGRRGLAGGGGGSTSWMYPKSPTCTLLNSDVYVLWIMSSF